MRLCHYPIRSPAQYAGKIAVGYLKYAAWPEWDRQLGSHYIAPYQALLAGGLEALERRMNKDSRAYSASGERVHEEDEAKDLPLDYRGGPLTLPFTVEMPLQNVLRYSQVLAGELVARMKEVKGGAESLERLKAELAAALDASRLLAVRESALKVERADLARELAATLDAARGLAAQGGALEAERADLAREVADERHKWLPWRLRHLFDR